MTFYETVAKARALLRDQGRISITGLMREFALDEAVAEQIAEELVEVQRLAARNGKVLVWIDGAAATASETAIKAPADAERRQLSVLFCDLVDLTRLADGMDPEDFREIVLEYYQSANTVIQRFGGHVAQYLGDGLLVYFGYPTAHEDDAERAVRAGLAIIESLTEVNAKLKTRGGPNLSVRIGIHTGPVVLGGASDGEGKETVALGDTMNLAARLQSQAEPNTVVISARTLRLVQGVFVTRDLGERNLKGVAGETQLFRALRPSGVRSRLDVAAAAGLTPLIGRDHELALLESRFQQVEDGGGQVVLVGGEPGIGKSRLIQAFRERLAGCAHTWLECRASPLTRDSALYPVIELQRQGLGFANEDAPEEKFRRIEDGLRRAGFDLNRAMPLLADLHALPLAGRYEELALSSEGRRKQTLDLLCEWLLRLTSEQSLVLMIEDLHWMDPSTLEFLGQVLVQAPTARLMVLATYRPEFVSPWGRFSHVTHLQLSRLTRTQVTSLVQVIAKWSDISGGWIDQVVQRADGIPLFAEELARSAAAAGGDGKAAHIPETLQDSLTARLDALGPVKEVVQLCAALGREFSYEMLRAVSPLLGENLDAALTAAVREEIFYQRGAPPAATFLFKHALLRDAAYNAMVRTTRRRHHRRIADVIVDRMPQTAGAQPELVAYHYEMADALEEAVRYYRRAGHSAQTRSAHREAIEHFTKASDLFRRLPDAADRPPDDLRICIALGNSAQAVYGWTGEIMRKAYERAVELSRSIGDPDERVYAVRGLAVVDAITGNFDTAMNILDELKPIMCGAGPGARATVANIEGFIAYQRGDLSRALAIMEGSVAAYDPSLAQHLIEHTGGEVAVTTFAWLSLAHWTAGRPDLARERACQAVAHARAAQHPLTLSFMLCFAALTELECGRLTESEALLCEGGGIAREQGLPLWAVVAEIYMAPLRPGDAGAVERSGQLLDQLNALGTVSFAPYMLAHIAEASAIAGAASQALGLLEMARAISAQFKMAFWDAEIRRIEAETRLGLDPNADVEPLLREAIAIARAQDALSLELRAGVTLARWLAARGAAGDANALLAPIYGRFTEGFDTKDLLAAKALLEELSPDRISC